MNTFTTDQKNTIQLFHDYDVAVEYDPVKDVVVRVVVNHPNPPPITEGMLEIIHAAVRRANDEGLLGTVFDEVKPVDQWDGSFRKGTP